MDIGLIDMLLRPRGRLQELANIETAILKIATIIGCPGSGEPYERLVMACHRVAAYYLYPTVGTLEELYDDLAGQQDTTLVQIFYREYGEKEKEHE